MLLCKQTNCSWYLACLFLDNATDHNKGDTMSDTASLRLSPSTTLFSRLLSVIDRLLMAHAEIAIRNGDLPYFGL
jgi:hypothetical protein